MSLGVVIVSYRCRELLLKCLASIEERAPQVLANTVVVDNASGDGTPAAVRERWPQVTVIESSRNVGFAAAANQGIRALSSVSVICLLNPDATLSDDGLFAAATYLDQHPEVGILGGRIVNADGSLQASARAFPGHRNAFFNRHSLATKFFPRNRYSSEYLMTGWAHDSVRPVDWVSGAFMFIHRRAIERVGIFDPGYFFSIEDVDLCRRVRDAGFEVVYFPGATVSHRIGGSSRRAVYRAMAAHHRGMWRYYRKHLRGNPAVDAVTFAGISARFGLHAGSYAARTTKNRILGRPNP
ncbi:MAG: glycosyltransferase family 2 protein [Dehalococcoidia bacterium]